MSLYFYSTFFTSVWVWLYALSGTMVKIANYLGIGIEYFKRFLDIDKNPFLCIGVVSIIIVSLIYLVVLVFTLFQNESDLINCVASVILRIGTYPIKG